MEAHALQTYVGEGCHNLLVPQVNFRISQIHIEVYNHQQRRPLGALDYGRVEDIYGWIIV